MKQIRYFLEAIFVYFLYFIFWVMGIDLASYIGGKIAETFGPLLKVDNTARKNIKSAMPEISDDEIDKIISGMWNNLGRVVAELPHIKKLSGTKYVERVEVVNAPHLENLINSNQPGLVVSGHTGNWEIFPKTGAEYKMPLALIYRHANNPYVEKLIQNSRSYMEGSFFPKGKDAARAAIKMLQQNGCYVGMLIDQKMNDGIETTFFGKKAMTASAPAELAIKFKTALLPGFVIRTKGANFKVVFHPPVTTENKTASEITQELNDIMEKTIRDNPSQWFWVHNRWPKSK